MSELGSAILTTIIAGAISLAGANLTLRASRRQVKKQLQQSQLRDVLQKRLDVYPKLWATLISSYFNWRADGKSADAKWVKTLISELNARNAECGIFFSQPVYLKFHQLYAQLCDLREQMTSGQVIGEEQLERLDRVVFGVPGELGLASSLKNDLGSYEKFAIYAETGDEDGRED